jgi:hypothetical protein
VCKRGGWCVVQFRPICPTPLAANVHRVGLRFRARHGVSRPCHWPSRSRPCSTPSWEFCPPTTLERLFSKMIRLEQIVIHARGLCQSRYETTFFSISSVLSCVCLFCVHLRQLLCFVGTHIYMRECCSCAVAMVLEGPCSLNLIISTLAPLQKLWLHLAVGG